MKVCSCGHAQAKHIYEEGACRPGFVCGSACTKYDGPIELSLEQRTRAALDAAVKALDEIKIGAGPYSLDPLVHAGNCVEAMKRLAVEALITIDRLVNK